MQSTQVEIKIDQEGAVQVAVNGCDGPSCMKVTEQVEKALGRVVHDELTDDYHRQPKMGVKANAGH